jgi:hypothetical protein
MASPLKLLAAVLKSSAEDDCLSVARLEVQDGTVKELG